MNSPERDDDYLTEAWCIANHLWIAPHVTMRREQVEITVNVEVMPRVQPVEVPPVLRNDARRYRGDTWEAAARAAAHGEGIAAAKIERMISAAKDARRRGTSIHFHEHE